MVEDEAALLKALRRCAERDFTVEEEYLARLDAFFPIRDELNCERTYEAIAALRKES